MLHGASAERICLADPITTLKIVLIASFWTALLDYLRVLTQWPPLTFVGALFFFWFFRESVRAILKRGFKGQWGDRSLDFREPPPQTVSSEIESDEAFEWHPNDTFELEPRQWVEILDRAEARLQEVEAELTLERIHSQIFGSQISLLESLSVATEGLTPQRVEEFYEEKQTSIPPLAGLHFGQWISYLFTRNLAALSPDGRYLLDVMGQALLDLRAREGNPIRAY